MQNVGAGWFMTQLTPSPLMVSLVQAASAIPVFFVVLPAGALADMVDRRRLLLFTQSWMIAASAALGVLTLLHGVGPWRSFHRDITQRPWLLTLPASTWLAPWARPSEESSWPWREQDGRSW
jgi:MFS family permease